MSEPSITNHFENIGNLARFIDASHDAEETYAYLTRGVCQHSQWDISSIQVLDLNAGLTIPIFRYDPFNVAEDTALPSWDAKKSPVAAVLKTGAPLILEDAAAQDDYPGFRDDAINRGYHTTIVIPLGVRDTLQRPMVYTVASRSRYEIQDGDVQFLQCVAELSTIAVRKVRKLQQEREEAKRMRSILEQMTSSLTQTLDGDATESLVSGLSDLFPKGWLAVDLTTGRGFHDPDNPPPLPFHSSRRVPDELISAAEHSRHLPAESPTTFSFQGALVAAEVSALQIDGTHVGALFFFSKSVLSHHERIAAQAGRLALSSFMLRGFIEFKARKVTAHNLIQRLLRKDWRDLEEIRDVADRLDFDLTRPLRMIVVRPPEGSVISERNHIFVQRGAQSVYGTVISTIVEGELVFLVGKESRSDTEQQQKRFLARIEPFVPTNVVLVMSDTSNEIEGLERTYETCLNSLNVAKSMGATGWVTPLSIGEFPTLMATADFRRIATYLDTILTGVLGQSNKKGKIALSTLEVFLNSGRRYQETADKLEIHVSTLRYRLEQISEQLDLNLSDPDRCFELELAIRLRKLQSSYEK